MSRVTRPPSTQRRRTATILAIVGLALAAALTSLPSPIDRTNAASAAIDTNPLSENALDTWEVVNADMNSSVVYPSLVWAFEEMNGVMYVGGRFQQVRSDAGTTLHDQAYLAAFDMSTGTWIDTFRPQLDHPVWSLKASPDGSRLLVGGEFTNVDGHANTSALAALDPATGTVDAGFVASVTRTTGIASVMDIETHGSDVYIAGNYTHVQNAGAPLATRQHRVSKLDQVSGAVDWTFDVRAGGGRVVTIAIPPDGSTMYLGGYFSALNGQANTRWFGAVDLATGRNVIPNPMPLAQNKGWLFDLAATDDAVYLASERHRLFVRESGTLNQTFDYLTSGYGGDPQAIVIDGNTMYVGSHAHGYMQEVGNQAPRIQVQWVTAYDLDTMQPRTDFIPNLSMSDGVWALHVDTEGKLWVGGDPTRSNGNNLSGFAVFPVKAADAPVELARNKVATQSTSGPTGVQWHAFNANGIAPEARCPQMNTGSAGNAVDGKTAGGMWECSFASTTQQNNPWWEVDLGAPSDVDQIRLWNVQGLNQADGIDVGATQTDLHVFVSPNPFVGDTLAEMQAQDGVLQYVVSGNIGEFADLFINQEARYVRVQRFANNTRLRLAEVEIFDIAGDPPPDPPDTTTLVSFGDTWRYLDTGVGETDWNEPTFVDAAWSLGATPMGFGNGNEATVTQSGVLTTYARTTFDVADPATISGLTLSLVRDDGAAVYLNGTEIARDNLAAGVLTSSTYASAAVWGAAELEPVIFAISADLLVAGTNTLAVEVHNNAVNGGDLSFDLELKTSDVVVAPPAAGPTELVMDGHQWRYDDSGVMQPNWTEATFDDSGWSQGPAQFGFGDGDEATVTQDGVLTTYARTSFTVSDPAALNTLTLHVLFDDGAALYLNGLELDRWNLPAGTLDADTYATTAVWGPAETTWTEVTLDPAILQAGVNTLAVEVHNTNQNGGDLSFDLTLSAT